MRTVYVSKSSDSLGSDQNPGVSLEKSLENGLVQVIEFRRTLKKKITKCVVNFTSVEFT